MQTEDTNQQDQEILELLKDYLLNHIVAIYPLLQISH